MVIAFSLSRIIMTARGNRTTSRAIKNLPFFTLNILTFCHVEDVKEDNENYLNINKSRQI